MEKGTFVSNRAIFLRWGARTSSTKLLYCLQVQLSNMMRLPIAMGMFG
jgi:hypothetical protein